MEDHSGFYTLKGYTLLNNNHITASMEDYLEMIFRLHKENTVVRINQLAQQLHVKPSSASKMVSNLKKLELVEFEKYGTIVMTKEGLELGEYLLYRHELLHKLFCLINQSDNELEQVEKVEHFIDVKTVHNLSDFLSKCQNA